MSTVSCFGKEFKCDQQYTFTRKKDAENFVSIIALDSAPYDHKDTSQNNEDENTPSNDKDENTPPNNEDKTTCSENEEFNSLIEYINNKKILAKHKPFYTWIASDSLESPCKIEYEVKTIDLDNYSYRLRHLKLHCSKFEGWDKFDPGDFIRQLLPSYVEWCSSCTGVNTYDQMFEVPHLGEYIQITLSCA
jgi:hypothetical protein